MAEPVSLQTLLTYLTLISIPVGVFYHIMTLRNTRKNQELTLKAQEQTLETRQAQLFMNLYESFKNKEFLMDWWSILLWEWSDIDDFNQKYGILTNPDAFSSFSAVAGYLEGVGVLLSRNLLDPTFVDDLMSGPVRIFWEKFKPVVEDIRIRWGNPAAYEWVEYLYEQIIPIVEEQHPGLKT
jgi:hypothetical protein